jgi:hypothetical protein
VTVAVAVIGATYYSLVFGVAVYYALGIEGWR